MGKKALSKERLLKCWKIIIIIIIIVATWSESDEDSLEEECLSEDVNICFNALE